MPRMGSLTKDEAKRVEPCQGCKYLGIVGGYGCCLYFDRTSVRRPCPRGEGCTVKDTDKSTGVYRFGSYMTPPRSKG